MGMIKSGDELLNISKTAAIGDICFEHIIEYICEGMTELDVAKEIETTLLKLGASSLSFPTIVVSGKRTCLPHGEPTSKIIENGDLLTLDFGAIYKGQCGDMTRTIGIGFLDDEQKKIYDIVLESQEKALRACKSGAMSQEIDRIARGTIEDEGYGQYFVHGTGHGVGTKVHEEPYLNTRTNFKLEENMAITIEPGIYIPDKLGVRIEDLAIITDFGIINLVKSPKNLIII